MSSGIGNVATLLSKPLPRVDFKAEDWQAQQLEYDRLLAEQEALRDEIAYARVLARRGQMPDKGWTEDDDPRLVAWRKLLEDEAREGLSSIVEPFHPSEPLTSDALDRLVARVNRANRSLQLLVAERDARHGR